MGNFFGRKRSPPGLGSMFQVSSKLVEPSGRSSKTTDGRTDGRRTVFPQTSIQLQHAHTQAREMNETPISDTKPPPFGRWFDNARGFHNA